MGRRTCMTAVVAVVLVHCGKLAGDVRTPPDPDPGGEGGAEDSPAGPLIGDSSMPPPDGADPCGSMPRGGGIDAVFSEKYFGCTQLSVEPPAPSTDDCSCGGGDYWIDLDGDGATRRLSRTYPLAVGCRTSGASFMTPVCIVSNALAGCRVSGDINPSSSCFFLSDGRKDAKWVAGHYVGQDGRCWTLYDPVLTWDGGAVVAGAVTGTFRATAERCDGKLELRGTFRACYAWKWNGSCN